MKRQPLASFKNTAVALKYDPDKDSAPKVTAKGKGYIARKIIELAREKGIPVREDPDLLELLYTIELNEEIPPELYKIIAEVLSLIYKVNNEL